MATIQTADKKQIYSQQSLLRVLFKNAADPYSEVENRFPPLWPACLAAYIEKTIGTNRVIFKYSSGSLDNDIKAFKPHILGISSVTQNFNYAKRYAATAKKHGLFVMMGGIHISLLPNNLNQDMDVGIMGEGEETFAELICLFLNSEKLLPSDLRQIRGVVFHEGAELVVTPSRPLFDSLDSLPQPRRTLLGYQRHDYMFTSRGCPYRCVFCSSCRFWDKVRYHSPEYVVDQIGELIKHSVDLITFYDDLFVGNVTRLKRIAEMIVERGYHKKCQFHCSSRSNLVTPEVIGYLKSMNVTSVGMGLESGCERILKFLKGHVSVKDNRNAVNLLKDAGLEANASFVIGAPDETETEMMETLNFIKMSRLDFIAVYVLTPLPGTPIWDYALKRGLVSDNMDWSLLSVNFETHPHTAIILAEKLSRNEMIGIYKKFRRLRLYMILKALPHSALLREMPRTILKLIAEKIIRFFKHLAYAKDTSPSEN